MTKTYRKGPVGALMDEYERAAGEFIQLIQRIPKDRYETVLDAITTDENCRSIQTITAHVVDAGYGYANYIRSHFGMQPADYEERLLSQDEVTARMQEMLELTSDTLEGRWELSDEEIQQITMDTRWGSRYDLEQLLEHAIVHLMRHRRQIERFIA